MKTSTTPTPEQAKIIDSAHNLICIIACAGSGKTYALTHRISRLINESHVDACQVAAITFTVNAAEVLKFRLAQLLNEPAAAANMFIGTIHSFCYNLLQDNPGLAFVDLKVLSENQQFILLNRFWKDWKIDALLPNINAKGPVIERLISAIEVIKLENIPIKVLIKHNPQVADIFLLYSKYCKDNYLLDYGDLLYNVANSISTDIFRDERLGSKVKYLFVDEYQDVDALQADIVSEFSKRCSVCVVGDDDQAIYQFRGTDVRNILDYSKKIATKTYVLSENRRCPTNIKAIAKNCIVNVSPR